MTVGQGLANATSACSGQGMKQDRRKASDAGAGACSSSASAALSGYRSGYPLARAICCGIGPGGAFRSALGTMLSITQRAPRYRGSPAVSYARRALFIAGIFPGFQGCCGLKRQFPSGLDRHHAACVWCLPPHWCFAPHAIRKSGQTSELQPLSFKTVLILLRDGYPIPYSLHEKPKIK